MRLFFSFLCLSMSMSWLIVSMDASAATRIINGKRAKANDWPWMVAILYTNRVSILKGQFCGGTLIHPSWVLTAAHCTDGETINTIEVLVGRNTLSDNRSGKIIKIKQIIRHFNYDGHPDNPTSDLALLQLEQPTTQPVLRIANRYHDLAQDGTIATVMGWGATEANNYAPKYSDNLQQTSLPIVSNVVCNAKESYHGDVQEAMLCAGFDYGLTDACVGDSGGPLVMETNQGWQQIGIVSWGEGCALANYYGVYTRLSSFQEFVTQAICEVETALPSPHLQVNSQQQETGGYLVTASWTTVEDVDGYQFYYAPYWGSLDENILNYTHSFDVGKNTNITEILTQNAQFYLAVKAYRGNCYSDYSNIEVVLIP